MEKRLLDICDRLIKYFNWDIEKETEQMKLTGSRRITKDEVLKKNVYRAKSNSINYGLGITTLYNDIGASQSYSTNYSDYVCARSPEDFTTDRVLYMIQYLKIMQDLVELYDEWNSGEFSDLTSDLQNNDLFGNTKIEVDPEIIQRLDEIFKDNDQFKIYKYVDGGDQIHSNDKYHISTEIGFSSDLNTYLRHIKSQEEYVSSRKDEVFISLYGKLDEVSPIYSNWLLVLCKGKSVWIVTDQMNFDNPGQKSSRLKRASAWKDADEKFHNIDLPYDIFFDDSRLRADTTSLTTEATYSKKKVDYLNRVQLSTKEDFWTGAPRHILNTELSKLFTIDLRDQGFHETAIGIDYEYNMASTPYRAKAYQSGRVVGYWDGETENVTFYKSPEFLFMKTKDLKHGEKMFLVLLAGKVLEAIPTMNNEFPRIELASEFINRKMIEGSTIVPDHSNHMEYWTDHSQEIFREMIDTIEDEFGPTKALTVKSYGEVLKLPRYNVNWLATPKQQESLAEWLILDRQADDIRNKQKALANGKIYGRCISHMNLEKELLEFINPYMNKVVDNAYKGHSVHLKTKTVKGFRSQINNSGHITNANYKGVDEKRGFGIGKVDHIEDGNKWDIPEPCQCCDRGTESRRLRQVHIRHYRDILWLIGESSRSILPRRWQNYRAHSQIPYTGNSLLDQTHPYLRVIQGDPTSNNFSNGVTIDIFLCGRCHKSNLKNKPESIDINIKEV